MTLDFTVVADVACGVGESPVYDETTRQLYFVDIPGCLVYAVDLPTGQRRSWRFESAVGSLGLAASGRLVVALRDRVILFDPRTGERQELCTVEADRPETRLNDGRVGPDGAFWVGTMDDRPERQPIAALYRVDPSGRVERKVEGLTVSNGLAWTADGATMFHTDSRGPWIDRWRFDPQTGAMSDRTRIATLDEATGRPDGGSCDAEGFYWSAGVSAGRLNRFSADGQLVESFPVPVPSPTMPCFGGPGYRTLYLTSLRGAHPPELLDHVPRSGSLLAAAAPVAGFPAWRFRDA